MNAFWIFYLYVLPLMLVAGGLTAAWLHKRSLHHHTPAE